MTGYWPLAVVVLLLVSLPYYRLESAHDERMAIWGGLVRHGIEQETAFVQPAADMVWQRDKQHAKFRIVAGVAPAVWLVSAVIWRKPLRRALLLDRPG